MFTGIITDMGTVLSVEGDTERRLRIGCSYDMSAAGLGDSIACNGICLTVTDKDTDSFSAVASAETIAATTLGTWQADTSLNLEQALRVGDPLGGHIVSGHVDGVGTVRSIEPVDDSHRITIRLASELAPLVARKGSVTVDGVSLTINGVEDTDFDVNIIPHTWDVTTLGQLQAGSPVNIEIDMLARYVARQLETQHG